MSQKISALQNARKKYEPKLPRSLKKGAVDTGIVKGEPTNSIADQNKISELFQKTYGTPVIRFGDDGEKNTARPLNIGVVLSGGQAPGGHNVIAGIFDGIRNIHPDSQLLGFLGGPSGLENGKFKVIDSEFMDNYRNTGGFDIIGSGRTKLETEEQFQRCLEVIGAQSLDAIVIIGGDDSNTNAAVLAEYLKIQESSCSVVGVPKTIDGDLKNKYIEASFGFDTAAKTFSELIGNILRDANSAKKYWHFIKLMGRSASHIALEAALQTHPNFCFISEEVEKKKMTLEQVVDSIVGVVVARARAGKNFGIVLIPEGLIEFIPEMGMLIQELSDIIAEHEVHFATLHTFEEQAEWVNKHLGRDSSYVFSSLPNDIQRQLLMDRDPHGNVQVSRIETDKLLSEMVEAVLKEKSNEGEYEGMFSPLHHFFGYEGRCAAPSNFDADYCYSLGYGAAVLALNGMAGYMSCISNLTAPAEEWVAGGIPITMLMNMERRHGKDKPVIQKALVELDGAPFKFFKAQRKGWSVNDDFQYPGPIQYFGPTEVCDLPTMTLQFEKKDILTEA